jgi:hypothetical protein
LNIPVNRIEPEQTYNLGRATEITRDEVKFSKMITRLQTRFSQLFLQALEKQLILKKIITPEDWNILSDNIRFNFAKDNHYSELKDLEVLNDRLNALNLVDAYVGKYYSSEWVRKNVLRQTDEDIEEINTQIEGETEQGIIVSPEDAAAQQQAIENSAKPTKK